METTITVPQFESNQILSSTHLTQLREYLDNEIRISRTRLTGVGIVNGLQIKSYDKTGGIIILTSGYGVTTDGYLLELSSAAENCEINYTHYRPYTDPSKPKYQFGQTPEEEETPTASPRTPATPAASPTSSSTASAKKSFSPQSTKPAPSAAPSTSSSVSASDSSSSTSTPKMFELLTDEAALDFEDARMLSNFSTVGDLDDMAVVLFREEKFVDLKSCTGMNCDNKGKKQEVTVRVLLVNKSRLHIYDPAALLTVPDPLRYISIPELSNHDLVSMHDVTSMRTLYVNKVIHPQKGLLDRAIREAYGNYGYLLALTNQHFEDALTKLAALDSNFYIQYVMDALEDVTMTFNEFAAAAYEYFLSCRKVIFPFPRHLTLGLLKPTVNYYFDEYRTVLFEAPPIDQQDRKLIAAQMLFERMLLMLTNFHIPGELRTEHPQLRITPSRTTPLMLSERSIPFYYGGDLATFIRFWNAEKTLRGQQTERMGYFALEYGAGPEFINPFDYSVDEFPFNRIEGIGGKDKDEVLAKLSALKQDYNLSFKVIALRLDQAEELLAGTDDCRFGDLQEEYMFHRGRLLDTIKTIYDYANVVKFYIYPTLDASGQHTFDIALGYLEHFQGEANSVLPPCLRDFNYADFKARYKALINFLFGFMRTTGMHQLFTKIAPRKGTTEDSAMSVLISFITKLVYSLIDCFFYRKLYRIYVSYVIRYQRSLRQTEFSEFARLHPGMKHKAGTGDGTFIIVYTPISASEAAGLKELNDKLAKKAGNTDPQEILKLLRAKKPAARVAKKAKKAAVKSAAAKSIAINTNATAAVPEERTVDPYAETIVAVAQPKDQKLSFDIKLPDLSGINLDQAVKDVQKKYYDLRAYSLEKSKPVEEVVEPYLKNIVVADFMLPYQCCDDYTCDTMCFSENELSHLPIPPFAKDDFALTHVNSPVDIYPEMNDATAPANVAEIVEIVNNQVITTAMGGTATPSFTSPRPHFIYQPPHNDEGLSDSFEYTLRNNVNGLTDKATVYIEVVPLPPAHISLKTSVYCGASTTVEKISIDAPMRDPNSLTVTGPGTYQDTATKDWYFNPATVASGSYVLQLMQDGKPIATFNYQVVRPVANFTFVTMTRDTNNIYLTLANLSTDAEHFEWFANGNFLRTSDDTQNVTLSIPFSIIGTATTFNVTLEATHMATGCKSDPHDQQFAVPNAQISLKKSVFCSGDDKMKIHIDDGGWSPVSVIGSGVQQESDGWYFYPSQVGGEVTKDVTLKLVNSSGLPIAQTVVRVIVIISDFEAVSAYYDGFTENYAAGPFRAFGNVIFTLQSLAQPQEATLLNWTVKVGPGLPQTAINDPKPTFTLPYLALVEANYIVQVTLVAAAPDLSGCSDTLTKDVDLSPFLITNVLKTGGNYTYNALNSADYKNTATTVDTLYNNGDINVSSAELTGTLLDAANTTVKYATDPKLYEAVSNGTTEQPIETTKATLDTLDKVITATATPDGKTDPVLTNLYQATLTNYTTYLAVSPNELTTEEAKATDGYINTLSNYTTIAPVYKAIADLGASYSTDTATSAYLSTYSSSIKG